MPLTFAPERVVLLQVPEERLAVVADAALHTLLALAELARRHRAASCRTHPHTVQQVRTNGRCIAGL